MTVSRSIMPPPFTIIYLGFGRFAVHKGYVFQATNGQMFPVKFNGNELTHAWTEDSVLFELTSGTTLSIVVTHGSKEEKKKYEIVDLTSAEIQIGEPDDLSSDTKTAIKLGSVEYEDMISDPKINQNLNSDVYLAIFGTTAVVDE